MRSAWVVGLTAGSLLTLAACAADEPVVEASGECADANGAELCTWASTQGDAMIEEGVTVPLASIADASPDAPPSWPPAPLAAPSMPGSEAGPSGFDHLTMLWEPMGHPPKPYLVPHFDFHFYLIPTERRLAIDCTDLSKPEALPEGYSLPDEKLPPEMAEVVGTETLVGVCVPQMGMHALNTEEMEADEPFQGSMVVGYYQGEPIFLEPMIPQTRLLQRRSFELPVPAIPGIEGSQPTVFRADYVEDQDAYRFTFAGFGAGT